MALKVPLRTARNVRLGCIRAYASHTRRLTNRRTAVFTRTATSDAPLQTNKDKDVTWEVRVLYDGECPLCMREINMLRQRDERNKISFVDIASPEYEPVENGGIPYGKAMGRIHGLLPDGRVIEGVEVFRRCYDAVGLGWVYAMTQFEPVERFANLVYNVWAKYRLPLTGRSAEGIEDKYYWNEPPSTCADSESCEIPWEEDAEKE